MAKYNREASSFKMAIMNSIRVFHGDDEDILWDKVLSDVLDNYYNSKSYGIYDRPKFETPFVNSERPDIYYEGDGFIIGIEHFQVDSSKKTRKGSSLVLERKQIDDEIDKEYSSQENAYYYTEKVLKVQFSYENYVKSLVETFKKHEKNIVEYRKNLSRIAPAKEVYLAFYIEDITTLGNYIITSKGREAIVPLCIREFIDELAACKGLDYVIVRVQKDYRYTLHIQQLSAEYIQSLYEECYDLKIDKFLAYQPVIASSIGDPLDRGKK